MGVYTDYFRRTYPNQFDRLERRPVVQMALFILSTHATAFDSGHLAVCGKKMNLISDILPRAVYHAVLNFLEDPTGPEPDLNTIRAMSEQFGRGENTDVSPLVSIPLRRNRAEGKGIL